MAGFDINWSLAQPVNVGGAFQQGWQTGQAMRQEADTRGALVAYAKDPSMETANALLPYDPRLGMQMIGQQREMAQQTAQRTARTAAVRGDPGAMDALAGIDFDSWSKIDVQQREKIKQATAFMGQAVLDVSRLPEPERAAAWAGYVQRAEANGMDIPAHYEQYSPQALNAAAAEAGQMEKVIKQGEPDWSFSPNGGLIDKNNPDSIAEYKQWMAGQGAPKPVGNLPPPPPGFQLDNAGGPTSSASGGFPK